MNTLSFFEELKRRNVIRVGIAYAVTAWVLAQVAEFAFETFAAPDWVLKTVVVVLALGLPVALLFAWAFELTPEGLKREKRVDRTQSITQQTGHKLDRAIIVVLLVAIAWFAWDKFGPTTEAPATTATVAAEPVTDEAVENSVAVLPFVAMSSGPDDEFFADGLTEEILNSLAQLPELLVTARTSAFSFKGRDIPIQEIAMALGVRHVVEGSVRRSGDRMRVTAQLIRATDGFHLWSETYDSTSADAIAVQENIAEKIAVALDVVLDERKRESMRKAGLRDVEAFTLYQKANYFFNRAHGEMDMIEGLREANRHYEQVIERVPEFAQVYIDHSDLYVHMLNNDVAGQNGPGVTPADIEAALPAVLADYAAANRHARSDEVRYMADLDLAFLSGNWRGLGGRVERALRQPGCFEGNWLSVIALVAGYAESYGERVQQVLTCDPLRSLSWLNSARAALLSGDAEAALGIARDGIEIAPGSWLTMGLVRTLAANGLYDEARREIESRFQDRMLATALQVLVAATEGDREQADAWIDSFYEGLTTSGSFMEIEVHAWAGNRDEANRVAARYDQHPFGHVVLWQILNWCMCGAPWDLDVTPNFAAKFRDSNLAWPPPSPFELPLKDW